MPNYRYNTPDYMRRNTCSRQQTTACPAAPRQTCCDDGSKYDKLSALPIAMAYVPWQEWRALYEVEKGFHRGTIFEELDKPFKGMGGCSR